MKIESFVPIGTLENSQVLGQTRHITDNLYIRSIADDNDNVKLAMFIVCDKTILCATVDPEAPTLKLSDVTNQILADIITGNIDMRDINIDKQTVIATLNIIGGDLAKMDQLAADPNKIYFQLVTGDMFTYDKSSINWEEQAANIDALISELMELHHMQFLLATLKDQELEDIESKIDEFLKSIREKFGVKANYEVFNSKPLEHQLTLQLTDIITIYSELIMLTNVYRVHRDTTEYYEHENGENTDEEVNTDSINDDSVVDADVVDNLASVE